MRIFLRWVLTVSGLIIMSPVLILAFVSHQIYKHVIFGINISKHYIDFLQGK